MPQAFQVQMQQLLGDEWDDFAAALQQPAPISIRYNPYKNTASPAALEKVSWSPNAYYLPERPVFTLDPAFHAGAYYVQEASSMFVGEVIRQLFPIQKPAKVLDLCAAPGGKTTDLLSCLPAQSLLVCNEVIRSRFQILKQNVIKWGQSNVILSNHDSKDFARLNGFFDVILVDAPCSGEGLFRKDPGASSEWSPNNVQLCTGRQKRILAKAADLLAPGGVLIFSTCTYNRKENEGNASWMMNTFGLEPISLDIPEAWNIVYRDIGYQFYPHRIKGEGFYIAVMTKKDGPYY
jgi:16S rRNA C967 or C1407 C5-methylase (RsmB/RsmF family)